jgi:branched-chain amino acid transport system ATP-binding protein
MSALELRSVTAGYGEGVAIRDIDLTVEAGEVVALVGANGAGKTTTLRVASGLIKPMAGDVLLDGRSTATLSPQAAVPRGLAHVPEGRGVFSSLTVAEHFRLGDGDTGAQAERAYDLFPALRELKGRRAGLLSGGEQQMLSLARMLVREPRVLLVDELSLGLAPVIVERLLPVIRKHADEARCGVLLVEQHVRLAFEIADRAYVLTAGQVSFSGGPGELADTDALISSYLGSAGG